ncbi:hypothetical protein HYW74_02145 [Candidatus Pacearchaeota archaeon]|nr:hypothetical protein [Candidatus Pacearchaeota archaeon]
MFKEINGFGVVLPEVLLILKLNAEIQRHETIKGFKDRIDILSLLQKVKFDKNLLFKLSKEYGVDLGLIRQIIKESSKEYSYFFQDSGNIRELKKFKVSLLKEMQPLF